MSRTTRTTTTIGLSLVLSLPLASCATRQDGAPTPGDQSSAATAPSSPATGTGATTPPITTPGQPGNPSLSDTRPPTMRPPGKPPQEPSDRIPPDVIGGHISRGGSGPCYGVITDDGVEYSLYGRNAGTFAVGARVTVTIAPLLLKIGCGTGKPASIVEIIELR